MALRIGKNTSTDDNAPDRAPQPPGDATPPPGPAPERKGIKPLFLVLGLVIVAALGGGAYVMFGMEPPEEEFEAPAPGRTTSVGRPGGPTAAGRQGLPGSSGAPGAPVGTGASGKPAGPGGTAAPVGAPRAPVGEARPAGAPAAATLPPRVRAKLKQLWDEGANAKHRNDYKAASAAWQKILQLRPGHPGIQEAIDKLPPR